MQVRVRQDLPVFTRVGKGVVFWTYPIKAGETLETGRTVELISLGTSRRRRQKFIQLRIGEKKPHFALASDLKKLCEPWRRRRQPVRRRN